MHITENIKTAAQRGILNYVRPMAALWVFAFFAILTAYYSLFGNYHAKRFLEVYLSHFHNTNVTVGSVRLSLLKGLLEATDIQIGHPTLPTKNLYEVQSLTGTFQLAPLLRKQIVFDKVEFNGIRYLSPRLASESAREDAPFEKVSPMFEKFSANLFTTLNSNLAKNPLRHLAQLSTGLHTKELIFERLPHLGSSLVIDQVQRELAKAEHQVEAILESQTTPEMATLLETRDLINQTQENLRAQIGTLDENIIKDTANIRKGLGLPESDSDSFAPTIFGPKALDFVELAGRWVELFRRKMPVRSGPVGKSYVLQDSRRGKSIHFPYLAGHPTLVVRDLVLHSKVDVEANTGFVEGTISGLTSDPYILGRPANGNIKLSFPDKGLDGISIAFEIDHVGDEPKEHLTIEIDSFELKNSSICKITDLSLEIAKGTGVLSVSADFSPHSLKFNGTFKSKETEFRVTSPYKKIETYIQSLLIPFYQFELATTIEGPLDNLKLTLNSSVDNKLTMGLNDEIKRQLSAIDDTIKGNLMDNFRIRKQAYLDRLDKMKRIDLETLQSQIEQSERKRQVKKTSRNEHLSESPELQ